MMQYKVVTRKNPINKTKKFYPALVSPQPVDKTKIIERIEKRCTLASADVKAVLDALEVELIDCLQEGWSVRLGDFGSFRVSLRTRPRTCRRNTSSRPTWCLRPRPASAVRSA